MKTTAAKDVVFDRPFGAAFAGGGAVAFGRRSIRRDGHQVVFNCPPMSSNPGGSHALKVRMANLGNNVTSVCGEFTATCSQ